MIARAGYKNKEAIVVESDALRATFLPKDGAKMASLIDLSTNRDSLDTRWRILSGFDC